MPTARELLEQADALMRRNRGVDVPRSPTPVAGPQTITYGPTISPRTIQREPIVPSNVDVPPPPADAEQPAPETDDSDVPLLTDAVEELLEAGLPKSEATEDDAPVEPAPSQDRAINEPAVDDVPLLTDAVEEIDVTVVDEVAQGEPSYWELSTGEASVLGSAPDSIAVVPEPAPEVEQRATSTGETDVPGAPEGVESLAEPPPVEAEPEVEAIANGDPLGLDQPPSERYESSAPEVAPAAEATVPDTPATEQVRAIAEEIGMQVLQRIDIFSDTELRSQLRERMKPTVERISAELAAEINQHVGELVRVYIAEAIDREIESWRKGGQ